MNRNSECPSRYKRSVINSFLIRVNKNSSCEAKFKDEIDHIRKMLGRNNYNPIMINECIDTFLRNRKQNEDKKSEDNNKIGDIKLFYEAQFHKNYKIDENVLSEIIKNNVKPTDGDRKINLLIYYRNRKASNLVIRNDTSPKEDFLRQTNVVYEFKCPMPHGQVA